MAHMLPMLVLCVLAGLAGQPANAGRGLEHHLGTAAENVPGGITQSELQELVSVVFQEGHEVDFGLLCTALKVQHLFEDCVFRQVSVRLHSETDDVLTFNVPNRGSTGVAFVIVCHTAQDVNEIFVVSMTATLRRAFVSGSDGRFVETDAPGVDASFRIDMAYLARNLGRAYDDLGLQRPPHRR